MSQKEFEVALVNELTARMSGFTFELYDIPKLQGKSYTGLTIHSADCAVAPTMSIEAMYSKYVIDGELADNAFDDITKEVQKALESIPAIDTDIFTNWEKASKHFRYQLIPVKGNEEQLKNVVSHRILDLALVVRIELQLRDSDFSSVLITKDMQKSYGKTEEEIFAAAEVAAMSCHPASLRTMNETLFGSGSDNLAENKLWVATTEDGRNGAAVIAYPGFLKECAKRLHGDFIILPSSIHEVLMIPDDGSLDINDLKQMVKCVNDTEVAPEDILSYNVYHYNTSTEELTKAS